MVTCSYCHHGIDRLTAVTTHGYTCTQHLSLTVPTVCDYKYCRASHHSSNSCSHFLTKRANNTPLGFCEPGDLCLSTCPSVFHHVRRSLIVHRLLGATKKKSNRQQAGYWLRWLSTLHKYVFAHICSCERRREKTTNPVLP